MSLEEFCLENNLNVGAVKLLQFSLLEGNEDCLDFLRECLKSQEFDYMLRITVCDSFDKEYKLKPNVPNIFGIKSTGSDKDLFNIFIKKLLMTLNAKGHPSNPQSSIKIINNNQALDSFLRLRKRIGFEFNVDKLVEVVIDYYKTVEYAKKLDDFLDIADTSYYSFKQTKYKNLR